LKAVFNSSPVIILSKLKLLEASFSLFKKNYVPAGVIDEITYGENKDEEAIQYILKSTNVLIKTVKRNIFYEKLRKNLGKGETEAILLALEINSDNDYVILDDKAARNKAISYGLNVKGTIGILRIFYQRGLLNLPPDDVYQELINYNFRVEKEIYKSILKEFY
jgi:predicted nucleic acid-binding protein